MSMTLEEAIEHAEEQAIRNEKEAERKREYGGEFYDSEVKACLICAEQHRQLAEWLKELAERRKQPEIIYCKDCENWDTSWQNDFAPNYHYCPMMDGLYSGDFYCAKAERRTDG